MITREITHFIREYPYITCKVENNGKFVFCTFINKITNYRYICEVWVIKDQGIQCPELVYLPEKIPSKIFLKIIRDFLWYGLGFILGILGMRM